MSDNYEHFQLTKSLLEVLCDDHDTLAHCAMLLAPADFTLKLVEHLYNAWFVANSKSSSKFCNYVQLCGRLFSKLPKDKISEIVDGATGQSIQFIVLSAMFYHLTTPNFETIRSLVELVFDDPNSDINRYKDSVLELIDKVGSKKRGISAGGCYSTDFLRRIDSPKSETTEKRKSDLTKHVLDEIIEAKGEFCHGRKVEIRLRANEARTACWALMDIADQLTSAMKIYCSAVSEQQQKVPQINKVQINNFEQWKSELDETCSIMGVSCRNMEAKALKDVATTQNWCWEVLQAVDYVYELMRAFLELKTEGGKKAQKELSKLPTLFRQIYEEHKSFQGLACIESLSDAFKSASRKGLTEELLIDCANLSLKISLVKYAIKCTSNCGSIEYIFHSDKLVKLVQICNNDKTFFKTSFSLRTSLPPQKQQKYTPLNGPIVEKKYFERNDDIYSYCVFLEGRRRECPALILASPLMAFADFKRAMVDACSATWQTFLSLTLGVTADMFSILAKDLSPQQFEKLGEQNIDRLIEEGFALLLTPPSLDKLINPFKSLKKYDANLTHLATAIIEELKGWGQDDSLVNYSRRNAICNKSFLDELIASRGSKAHGCELPSSSLFGTNDAYYFHLTFAMCCEGLNGKLLETLDTLRSTLQRQREQIIRPQASKLAYVNRPIPSSLNRHPHSASSRVVADGVSMVQSVSGACKYTPESFIPESSTLSSPSPSKICKVYLKKSMSQQAAAVLIVTHCPDGRGCVHRKEVLSELDELSSHCNQMENFGVLTKFPIVESLGFHCELALRSIGKLFKLLDELVETSEDKANELGAASFVVSCKEIFDGVTKWDFETTSRVFNWLKNNHRNVLISTIHDASKRFFEIESGVTLSYLEVYHLALQMKAFRTGISSERFEDEDDSEDSADAASDDFDLSSQYSDKVSGLNVQKMRLVWRFTNHHFAEQLLKRAQ